MSRQENLACRTYGRASVAAGPFTGRTAVSGSVSAGHSTTRPGLRQIVKSLLAVWALGLVLSSTALADDLQNYYTIQHVPSGQYLTSLDKPLGCCLHGDSVALSDLSPDGPSLQQVFLLGGQWCHSDSTFKIRSVYKDAYLTTDRALTTYLNEGAYPGIERYKGDGSWSHSCLSAGDTTAYVYREEEHFGDWSLLKDSAKWRFKLVQTFVVPNRQTISSVDQSGHCMVPATDPSAGTGVVLGSCSEGHWYMDDNSPYIRSADDPAMCLTGQGLPIDQMPNPPVGLARCESLHTQRWMVQDQKIKVQDNSGVCLSRVAPSGNWADGDPVFLSTVGCGGNNVNDVLWEFNIVE